LSLQHHIQIVYLCYLSALHQRERVEDTQSYGFGSTFRTGVVVSDMHLWRVPHMQPVECILEDLGCVLSNIIVRANGQRLRNSRQEAAISVR